MSLYEVVSSYGNKLQELMALDDMPQETIDDTKELLSAGVAHDGKEYVAVLLNLESEAIAISNAIQKMKLRLATITKKHDWLYNELHHVMEKFGINEISCAEFVAKIKNNPASLDIIDDLMIPPEYFEETKKIVINNKKIKQDLKDGVKIPGAQLITKTRLEIK